MLRPGALRNRTTRTRDAKRPDAKKAPGFLAWLRLRPCAIEGCAGHGKIEAAHVDYAGDKGTGTKVADRHAIPLCSAHHRDQHRIGWPAFEGLYRINALSMAAAYWAAWPSRAAWERKLEGRD